MVHEGDRLYKLKFSEFGKETQTPLKVSPRDPKEIFVKYFVLEEKTLQGFELMLVVMKRITGDKGRDANGGNIWLLHSAFLNQSQAKFFVPLMEILP